MAEPPMLETLASQISSSATAITHYCHQKHFPARSLGQIQLATLLPPDAPDELKVAKERLQESALKIQQLAAGPAELLGEMAVQNARETFKLMEPRQSQQLACLRWLCHFKIPQRVPLTSSVSLPQLASAAFVPLPQLRSIARMAFTFNFLAEPIPGHIAHSGVSAAFISNPTLMDWALFMTSASAMTATKMVEATEKYGSTVSKAETAFNISKNTDLPYFDWLKQDPQMERQFAGYMKNVTASEGLNVTHLVKGFDWASLGECTVVDVGGSSGHASIALATAFPSLRFIIQDLPSTLSSSAPNPPASLPPALSSRLTYLAHDFFTPQPLPAASVRIFLLRMILHDWPFADAVSILRHLAPCLTPAPASRANAKAGGRILIMDTVLPRPGSVGVRVEAALRARDLSMLQTFNSGERDMEDWVRLIEEVGKGGCGVGLRLRDVVQPVGSSMAVLEIERDDENYSDSPEAGTHPEWGQSNLT